MPWALRIIYYWELGLWSLQSLQNYEWNTHESPGNCTHENNGSQLFGGITSIELYWNSSLELWEVSSNTVCSSCGTSTSLALAFKALAANTCRLCWSYSEHNAISGGGGCTLKMARSDSHDINNLSSYHPGLKRLICITWTTKASSVWRRSPVHIRICLFSLC